MKMSSRPIVPFFIAAALLLAARTQAAFDTFLEFSGGTAPTTVGESKDAAFPKAIEIFSFSLGLSNPVTIGGATGGSSAGKVNFSDLSVMKRLDSASPSLFAASASGKHYDEVKLSLRKGGDKPYVFLVYTFKNVFVSSLQWSGSAGGDDVPTESVSLSFGSVSIKYSTQDQTGAVVPGTEVGWDIETNRGL